MQQVLVLNAKRSSAILFYKECDNEFYEVVDVGVCLNDHYGMICFNGIFSGCMDLVTFGFASHFKFDGMDKKWLATGLIDGDPASFYVEFPNSGYDYLRSLRGIGYVDAYHTRCLLYGHQQDLENCPK